MSSGLAARAAIAGTLVCWVAVCAWPAVSAVTRCGAGSVPESFEGASVFWHSVGWAVLVALLASVPGWVAGRAIRSARMGSVVLVGSLVAAGLPAYAVFWSWWQAAGPGSSVGDWAARTGHADAVRLSLLVASLVSWAWPLVAWCVAAQHSSQEAAEREMHQVDAAGWRAAIGRAWRADWPGLALGVALAATVVAGSTVTFDLAQVRTFGFELRTLDVQGTPAGSVLRAALPSVALAFAGALMLASWPAPDHGDGGGASMPRRPARSWPALVVVLLTVVAPLAALAWCLREQAVWSTFVPVALRGALGTVATAAAAGAVGAVVALGHLALAARAALPHGGAARWAERALFAGWLFAALVPGTVYALALTLAYNRAGLGPAVYDTPAIVVLAEVGRYGAVAAWLGRVSGAREPADWRHTRALEGGAWSGLFAALAPQARGAAVGAAVALAALGAGEVLVTARIEPPGWAWAAGSLLNAIHYQQPNAVLGTLAALGGLTVAAAVVLAVGLRRSGLLGSMAVLALAAILVVPGCREEPAPPGTLQVARWFGASGRGGGLFEYPRVLELDPRNGTIVVLDRQARIHRFSPDGRYVGGWQMPEFAMGKPTGACVDQQGNVWVADTHYHRVMVFDDQGRELRRWGEYGTDPGQFIFPCDVEMGPDGLVYVAEFGGNDRIQVFQPDGTFVRQFGSHGREPGQFDRPQSFGFLPGGDLLVADACNHRFQVVKPDGTPVRTMAAVGRQEGQVMFPYGLRVLPDGTFLVAEFGGNRVQRLDVATGACLGVWHDVVGAPPPASAFVVSGDGVLSIPSAGNQLRIPWAVAWRDNQMFVLDSGHARVLIAPLTLRTAAEAAANLR